MISADQLKRVLLTDPAKLLTALNIPQSTVNQLLIAAQMGDKAPPDLKARVEKAQWEARVMELEEKLQQKEVSERARGEADQVRAGASEYVTKGISKDCPTVAAVAKVDRASVEREIFDEIVKDAAARAHREPNGKPISFDEASRRVEKRYASMAKLLNSQSQPAPTAGGSTNAPKSGASNALKAATPQTAPSKQPAKAPAITAHYGYDPEWEEEAEMAMKQALANVRRPAR
jgi:hypothetical protein